MKTLIIIKNGWKNIYTRDSIFTMSNGDIVEYNNREYKVNCCYFEVANDTMIILVE